MEVTVKGGKALLAFRLKTNPFHCPALFNAKQKPAYQSVSAIAHDDVFLFDVSVDNSFCVQIFDSSHSVVSDMTHLGFGQTATIFRSVQNL